MSRFMKDSGIPWIGEIPAEWNLDLIGSLYTHRIEKVSDKDYPPLSVTKNGIVPQLETAAKTDDGDNRKLVKKGDFAINSRSDRRGSCGISPSDGSVSLINTVLSPRINMNPRFYNWLFHTESFADEFYKWGHGIVDDLWSTRWQEMKNISIVVPTLVEQQAIADFLDKKCAEIDELITLQVKIIEELKSYKQSVITEAVTKGLNPDVPMRDSGIEWIGDIPKGWELLRMKNICYQNPYSLSEKEDMSYEFDYVDIGSVSFEKGVFKTEHYQFKDAPSRARRKANKGDLILSTVRTYLRAIDIVDTEQKASYIYSTGFAILTPTDKCNYRFLSYISKSEAFLIQVALLSRGINYPSINTTDLLTISVVIPPLDEQSSIANYLDKKCAEIDSLITLKQSKIEQLKEYKKSIIYEYVTGKKEVEA